MKLQFIDGPLKDRPSLEVGARYNCALGDRLAVNFEHVYEIHTITSTDYWVGYIGPFSWECKHAKRPSCSFCSATQLENFYTSTRPVDPGEEQRVACPKCFKERVEKQLAKEAKE